MGQGKKVICSNCDYEEDFMLGKGFYLSSIENVKDLRIYLENENINWPADLTNMKNIKLLKGPSMEYFKCPVCKTLHNKVYFELGFDESENYSSEYVCQECKSILKPILNRKIYLSKYKCPKCKNKTLTDGLSIIMWD